MDRVFYKTENFVAVVAEEPHVSREEGGHIKIRHKDSLYDSRTDLTPELAKEVYRLSMLVGEAMKTGLRNRGIDLVRINYQENGNWAYKKDKLPIFQIHLYGRAKNSKMQKWPESLYFPDWDSGFYRNNESLNDEDIAEIQKQIEILEKSEKYNIINW